MFGKKLRGLPFATAAKFGFVAVISLGLTTNTPKTAANTLSPDVMRSALSTSVFETDLADKALSLSVAGTRQNHAPEPARLNFKVNDVQDFPAEIASRGLTDAQSKLAQSINRALKRGDLAAARQIYLKNTAQKSLAGSFRSDVEAALAAGFFYSGKSPEDLKQADGLARAAAAANQPLGLWIAGLSAWRGQDYTAASRHFTKLAEHPALNGGRRSAAHFWAYRSLAKESERSKAGSHLAAAARHTDSFYGLLAKALMLKPESLDEARLVKTADYRLPRWQPRQGFTTDRALIYALMRHESNLNPKAVSPRGASGLMQLMPATAVSLCDETNLAPAALAASGKLFEPEYNLGLGQAYVRQLASQPRIGDNLVYLLTAYNAGPNKLREWLATRASDDPLLFMESLPLRETRNYVERVLPHYWGYRVMLGQPLTSLRHLAAGVAPRLDTTVTPSTTAREALNQAPAPIQVASR